MNQSKSKISQAMLFIILFGIVSLFSDMTHEGASSIRGAYLSLLGASAATIGFISGLGELIGYSLRYAFGGHAAGVLGFPKRLDRSHVLVVDHPAFPLKFSTLRPVAFR